MTMAELQDNDSFLVNRNNTSYQLEKQNVMAELQDDDLMLVNRDDVSYKITGKEIKDSFSKPPVIGTVVLTEDDPTGARFTSQDFTTTVTMDENGSPDSFKSIRGWVEGNLVDSVTPRTDEITEVGTAPGPVYSDGWTGSFNGTNDGAKSFDGNPSTFTAANSVSGSVISAYWAGKINYTNSCVFKIVTPANVDISSLGIFLVVNGTDIPVTTSNDYDIAALVASPITNIEIRTNQEFASTYAAYLAAIKVDGSILVDDVPQTQLTFKTDKDLVDGKCPDHPTLDPRWIEETNLFFKLINVLVCQSQGESILSGF